MESSVLMENVAGSDELSARSRDTTEPEPQSDEVEAEQIHAVALPVAVSTRSLVLPEMPSDSESKRCDDGKEATSTASDSVATVRMHTGDVVSPEGQSGGVAVFL